MDVFRSLVGLAMLSFVGPRERMASLLRVDRDIDEWETSEITTAVLRSSLGSRTVEVLAADVTSWTVVNPAEPPVRVLV